MTELKLKLPDDIVARLQAEASRRNVSTDIIIGAALERYLDDDEPTKEEILNSLRISMQEVREGNVRPAHDVLDELEREMLDDANES